MLWAAPPPARNCQGRRCVYAVVQESEIGTSRTCRNVRYLAASRSNADIGRRHKVDARLCLKRNNRVGCHICVRGKTFVTSCTGSGIAYRSRIGDRIQE
jgi:hypothetical protein